MYMSHPSGAVKVRDSLLPIVCHPSMPTPLFQFLYAIATKILPFEVLSIFTSEAWSVLGATSSVAITAPVTQMFVFIAILPLGPLSTEASLSCLLYPQGRKRGDEPDTTDYRILSLVHTRSGEE